MITIEFVAELFVGRAGELALLAALVAGLSAGVGWGAVVEGEQGVGKSSVLRAGLAGAEAAGRRVLWGAADELGQRFPLQVMTEIVAVDQAMQARAADPADCWLGSSPHRQPPGLGEETIGGQRQRGLVARGLAGVQLVTSDCHQGLRDAIASVLPGALSLAFAHEIPKNSEVGDYPLTTSKP